MYKLMLVIGDQEKLVMTSDKLLDVKLARERHVRSLTKGMMEIREENPAESK
ncbi:MAG: hypothetical protein AB1916_00460 [Thermodesulfobacteriota bacterium]